MRVLLIRHGETDWNKIPKLQGRTDVPLNEYGIWTAEQTAEELKEERIDVIYTSPLCRSVKTAETIRRDRDIRIIPDERLIEMSFGAGEGCNLPEVKAEKRYPIYAFLEEPHLYVPEDGETFEEVRERARDFTKNVLMPLEGTVDTVLVSSHGAFIRAFLQTIDFGPDKDFWRRPKQKNCAVTTLELTDGILTIKDEARIFYEEKHEGKI